MKIKTGDSVRVITGAHKGKVAKVVNVLPNQHAVKLEGIGTRKRFVKPTQINPQGGTKDIHVAIDVSKVALVHPTDAAKTTRVGYSVKKDGTKVRVARQAANKEIK
jgi:large subunit ribosomal protein L24